MATEHASSLWTRQDQVLLLVIAAELLLFSVIGDNFFSLQNFFELTRLGVSLGIVSCAMCFVIKTGGIDLSVASIMAFSAVVMGICCFEFGIPLPLAALLALLISALCGALNGVLICRMRLPPLIVTLGTMSLFKGLADALTGGAQAWSDFPDYFLALGQSYLFGIIPMQLPLLILLAVVAWLLMHRSRFGRYVSAIGFNREAAVYAAVPERQVLSWIYTASGFCAGLAMLVFVAKLGQAKADVGQNYELMSIAVVVLGGTLISGGRGSIHGTMLGLFAITLLHNGLSLAGFSTDIARIAIGLVLIFAILAERQWSRQAYAGAALSSATVRKEFSMTNQQVLLIVAAILIGALMIVASNIAMMNGFRDMVIQAPAPLESGDRQSRQQPQQEDITLALMPKTSNDPYFVSCHEGATVAAEEFGVEILWDGPTKANPARQNELIDSWITKGVDVIAASAENRDAISAYLRKARARGIKVLTWDADARPDARDYFVNQATAEGIGYTLADEAARLCKKKGNYIILSATTTAANQNEWIVHIKERMRQRYPDMNLLEIRYSDGERDKAVTETRNAINKYPDLNAVIAIAAPAVPGAAEAIKQADRPDIHLTGLSIPSLTRDYVHAGWIDSVILWNTLDLGYLTVAAARKLANGEITGDGSMDFGRLKNIMIKDGNIYLGEPFVFTKDNIDNFEF